MKSILFIWLLFLFATPISSQKQVSKFDPALLNYFQHGHELTNGKHRIYSTSNRSSHWGYSDSFITDWDIRSNLQDVWLPLDSMQGYPLIYSGYESFVMPLPNGNSIFISNNFDCDVSPRSDILFINEDRSIRWHKGENDDNYYIYEVTELGLVGSEILGLIAYEGETYYYSFEGQQIIFEEEPILYTKILFRGNEIYAFQHNRFVHLDEDFQEVEFIPIDTIEFIKDLGYDFLVQTRDKLMVLDENLNEVAQNDEISGVRSAVKMGDKIGIINDQGFFILDSNLVKIRNFPSLPNETMDYVVNTNDTAYVLSTYNGLTHSDFVIREYILQDTPMIYMPDLSINSLTLPDTVFVDLPYGTHWLIQFRFDSIYFDIYNHSQDTIRDWNIECDWSGGVQCSDYQKVWHFNNVDLLPSQLTKIVLEPFSTDILPYYAHPPFCFWIESPDGLPDINPANDIACQSSQLVLANEEIEMEKPFSIFPSPADDFIFIDCNKNIGEDLFGSIYDVNGKQLQNFELRDNPEKVSTVELASGVYFIHIYDSLGMRSTQKFLVQH